MLRTSCLRRARRLLPCATAAEAGSYDDRLRNELVELGWPGIAIAEEHGGQGLGIVELAVLAEELGYACASTPLIASAAAAPRSKPLAAPSSRRNGCRGLRAGS